MRRITILIPAALILLALGPGSALARHEHHRGKHHEARHHRRHARIERFGRDVTTASPTTNSADNAGTVQSFSNERLTIMLTDGSTVTGQVTRDSEIECTASGSNQTVHEDGDRGGDNPGGDGDNSGSRDDEGQSSSGQSSGDDEGDAAEQNEDQNENENENEMQKCPSSNLAHGTVVREAELRLSSAGSVWKKVELGS